MNKFKMDQQAVPGTIGGASSVIWMFYGAWAGWVPPDLTAVQEVALAGAIGVIATTLVNFIRHYTTGAE